MSQEVFPDYESLTKWVEHQKKIKELFEATYKKVKSEGDRLALIIATRAAFNHMIRTLRAFDTWLKDPMIIYHMPKDYLEEVLDVTYKLLMQLIDLDIKHTSAYRDYVIQLQKEGKLDNIPMILSEFEGLPIPSGGGRRRSISLST